MDEYWLVWKKSSLMTLFRTECFEMTIKSHRGKCIFISFETTFYCNLLIVTWVGGLRSGVASKPKVYINVIKKFPKEYSVFQKIY